jgi:hypothetical protein
MKTIHCLLTQYGYANDPDADTLTREGWGAWDNKLTATSCALKRSTAQEIGATPRCKIKIPIGAGKCLYRFWDDVVPESDKGDRCDLYQPNGFDNSLPDESDISVVADDGSTPANPVG